MNTGHLKTGADRVRRSWASLMVAGLGAAFASQAGDPPVAVAPVKPGGQSRVLPTNSVPRVPRPQSFPDLHPDGYTPFLRGNEDFRTAPPPFISVPPPESALVAPTKEEEELFKKRRDWIMQRPENQTSSESIKKLFKAGDGDYHLAGADEKAKDGGTWIENYIDAAKPAKPASKGMERERARDRARPLDVNGKDEPSHGKEDPTKSKDEKQPFQMEEDKWIMMFDKSPAAALPDQGLEAFGSDRPVRESASDFQKEQAFQRKGMSEMLNLPDEQSLNPRQLLGTLDLGLSGLPPQQDQFGPAADRGIFRSSTAGSLSSGLPKGTLEGLSPAQNPSLNLQSVSHPALSAPSEGLAGPSSRPTFQQPAVLPFPARPGLITPLRQF